MPVLFFLSIVPVFHSLFLLWMLSIVDNLKCDTGQIEQRLAGLESDMANVLRSLNRIFYKLDKPGSA